MKLFMMMVGPSNNSSVIANETNFQRSVTQTKQTHMASKKLREKSKGCSVNAYFLSYNIIFSECIPLFLSKDMMPLSFVLSSRFSGSKRMGVCDLKGIQL